MPRLQRGKKRPCFRGRGDVAIFSGFNIRGQVV